MHLRSGSAIYLEVSRFDSKCCAVAITSSDSNYRFNRADKDLAVTNFASACRVGNRCDHVIDSAVFNDNFNFEFLQEFNGEFRTAVSLNLAFLASKAANLANCHADDASLDQGDFDVLQLERTDDRFDLFHGSKAFTDIQHGSDLGCVGSACYRMSPSAS